MVSHVTVPSSGVTSIRNTLSQLPYVTFCVGQMVALKDTRSQSLEPVKVIICGRRDSAGVIKGFEMGRLLWIIWVDTKCNHKCPYKREVEDSLHRKGEGDVKMEQREI